MEKVVVTLMPLLCEILQPGPRTGAAETSSLPYQKEQRKFSTRNVLNTNLGIAPVCDQPELYHDPQGTSLCLSLATTLNTIALDRLLNQSEPIFGRL
jgi:hypothetical protein